MVMSLIDELDQGSEPRRQKDGRRNPRFPRPRRREARRVVRVASTEGEPARTASVAALESGPAYDVDHPEKAVAFIPPQDYAAGRLDVVTQGLRAFVTEMESNPNVLFRARQSPGSGTFSTLAIFERALDIREPDSEIPVHRRLWKSLLKASARRQERTGQPVNPHAMMLELLRAGSRQGALVTACRVRQFLGAKELARREPAYVILLGPEASGLASTIIAASGENGWGWLDYADLFGALLAVPEVLEEAISK
jgi:hypothetical protein